MRQPGDYRSDRAVRYALLRAHPVRHASLREDHPTPSELADLQREIDLGWKDRSRELRDTEPSTTDPF